MVSIVVNGRRPFNLHSKVDRNVGRHLVEMSANVGVADRDGKSRVSAQLRSTIVAARGERPSQKAAATQIKRTQESTPPS